MAEVVDVIDEKINKNNEKINENNDENDKLTNETKNLEKAKEVLIEAGILGAADENEESGNKTVDDILNNQEVAVEEDAAATLVNQEVAEEGDVADTFANQEVAEEMEDSNVENLEGEGEATALASPSNIEFIPNTLSDIKEAFTPTQDEVQKGGRRKNRKSRKGLRTKRFRGGNNRKSRKGRRNSRRIRK